MALTKAKLEELIANGKIGCPYGIGDILQTTNATSPTARWAGTTWAAIQNKFLVGVGSDYAVGATGGEATHTLTVAEMPSHRHVQSYYMNYLNSGSAAVAVMSGGTAGDTPSYQNTQYTGDGAAHNNLPPYYAVYMWRRTA